MTDAAPHHSISEPSLPLTPRDSVPAELASAFASAATTSADGLSAAAEDGQSGRAPAEVAVLASAASAGASAFREEESSSGAAAPSRDVARPAAEDCFPAAADQAGLQRLQSAVDQASAEVSESPQQSGQSAAVEASSSSSESQPDSPGTPGQAAELPRPSVLVRCPCRPASLRLEDLHCCRRCRCVHGHSCTAARIFTLSCRSIPVQHCGARPAHGW